MSPTPVVSPAVSPVVSTVAVQAGTSATRLAARGADGRAGIVATLPAGTSPAAALESLYGDAPVPVVVLVHPAGAGADGVGPAVAELREWAAVVRTVPAPLALLAGPGGPGSPGAGPGPDGAETDRAPRLVVDAGASGADLTVVVGERAMPSHRVDVGGDRLDTELGAAMGMAPARARAVRESLSQGAVPSGGPCDAEGARAVLGPVLAELATAAAGVVRRSGAVEVVVAGGLARTPALAELLDDAVDVPVRVVEVPEDAAVLGALDVPAVAGPGPVGERDTRAVHGPGGSPDVPLASGAGARRGWLRVRGAPVVAALGIALVAAGTVAGRAPAAPAPASEPAQGAALVQYGYATALPAGWEHTGGLPERRRTLLTRTGSPDGAELIAVERAPLGYDSAVEPERARAELAAEFRRRAAAENLRDYRADTVAGRPVLRYHQAGPGADVDWFVLFAGTDELVVGCRRPDAPAVAAACAAVVGSVRPAG
ncbi:type VII secretion-associated protein [Pseudonocardia sp. KRD291]|uniref:type VII secretion-associated protein n=1 Tax=Pseudonocardia sp. KRD291 TaxID=2792007 RepID=UPI001C4A0375|nr:type VII secretion-associated protein [Pseudonocardia sp. KRD291]MBW0105530.1 type VII secretion-associated protein [Pseudonocardia sp. KRD291]